MDANQIKRALTDHLYRSGASASLAFLEELKVHGGQAWADLVDASDLHCYEIKSTHDSLKRLIGQGTQYAHVFDRVTLVAAERHLDKALPMLPDWWGVIVVPHSQEGRFEQLRIASQNKMQEPEILATLLDRGECLEILSNLGGLCGWKSKSLYQLQGHIAEITGLDNLRKIVRERLVQRLPGNIHSVAH